MGKRKKKLFYIYIAENYISRKFILCAAEGGSCDPSEAGDDVVLSYSTNSGSTWTSFSTLKYSDYTTYKKVGLQAVECGPLGFRSFFFF